MPLAARQLIKVHLDSARFRMNKIKLAHAAEFHAFRTRAHPSFFSKIFCSYRRSVLQALPNTVDNFTDLRSCIESWRALSRLTHPTRKKAPVSLPVPISPPFAAFCVSGVFGSYHHQRTAQIRTATATRRIAKAVARIKSALICLNKLLCMQPVQYK